MEAAKIKDPLRVLLYLFLSVAFSGCNQGDNKVLSEEQFEAGKEKLVDALNDEASTYNTLMAIVKPFEIALRKDKRIGDFEFTAQYEPHLLLAVTNEVANVSAPLCKELRQSVQDYKDKHYIRFSMENTAFHSELLRYDLKSAQEYSDRIMYYSFYSNRDVYLVENEKDTLRNAFVHFERTFDVSPKLNFVFVFERKDTSATSKLSFVFEDVIFRQGRVNFEFNDPAITLLNANEVKKMML